MLQQQELHPFQTEIPWRMTGGLATCEICGAGCPADFADEHRGAPTHFRSQSTRKPAAQLRRMVELLGHGTAIALLADRIWDFCLATLTKPLRHPETLRYRVPPRFGSHDLVCPPLTQPVLDSPECGPAMS